MRGGFHVKPARCHRPDTSALHAAIAAGNRAPVEAERIGGELRVGDVEESLLGVPARHEFGNQIAQRLIGDIWWQASAAEGGLTGEFLATGAGTGVEARRTERDVGVNVVAVADEVETVAGVELETNSATVGLVDDGRITGRDARSIFIRNVPKHRQNALSDPLDCFDRHVRLHTGADATGET
jgi:hypothetical protein